MIWVNNEIRDAFYACVRADAALATITVSRHGDVNKLFYKFYGAFKVVYLLALNDKKFQEVTHGDGTLADAIQAWFDTAKDRKNAKDGLNLFREFNLTMGRLGMLSME